MAIRGSVMAASTRDCGVTIMPICPELSFIVGVFPYAYPCFPRSAARAPTLTTSTSSVMISAPAQARLCQSS